MKSASEKVVEAAQSGAKLIEQAPILSGLSDNRFMRFYDIFSIALFLFFIKILIKSKKSLSKQIKRQDQ